MKRKRWDLVLILISAICFGIYGFIEYDNYKLEKNAKEMKKTLMSLNVQELPRDNTDNPKRTPYDNLFEKNDDMIGWIKIPETIIDYPVMQTLQDEEYYLYRDFFGNEDKNGTLFMDTDCDLNDKAPNLIIHGHHMKSGAMFGSLSDYFDEEYYKEHPNIYFYTKEEEKVYEIMSVFTSKVYNYKTDKFLYYNYFSFEDEETFDEYYDNIKRMSLYDTGVTAEYGDEFITLSTCAYHTKNGRLAIVGRLRK